METDTFKKSLDYFDFSARLKKVCPDINMNDESKNFIIAWVLMEERVFDKYYSNEKAMDKLKNYQGNNDVIDGISRSFLEYYQNNKNATKWKNLTAGINRNGRAEAETILEKGYDNLSFQEKVQLLFYITQRYRNNMFHGNKAFMEWSNYPNQMKDLTFFMCWVIDNFKTNGANNDQQPTNN